MSSNALPMQVGRYRLLDSLGHGAYGFVYRAEIEGPLGFREELAVKVLHPAAAATDPESLLALADEATILRQLRHPHIVQFRGFESADRPDGEWHLLALEFVRGVTLQQLIGLSRQTKRLLPFAAVLNITLEALEALKHAHEARQPDGSALDLVHRDLKPANLMVDSAGQLRVLDFGIAWAQDRHVRTRMGVTKGSLPYMSPEQLLGAPLDGRSDLYVLGLILFELLTGEVWVSGPNPTQGRKVEDAARECLVTDWTQGQPRWRSAVERGGVRPLGRTDANAVATLLAGLLQRERNSRFASAADAREHLLRGSLRWDQRAGHETLASLTGRLLKAQAPAAPPKASSTPDPDATRAFGKVAVSIGPADLNDLDDDPAGETLPDPLQALETLRP